MCLLELGLRVLQPSVQFLLVVVSTSRTQDVSDFPGPELAREGGVWFWVRGGGRRSAAPCGGGAHACGRLGRDPEVFGGVAKGVHFRHS